jgi:MFS transporter, PAT family, beta-lactamase induction signal transducer AmpG
MKNKALAKLGLLGTLYFAQGLPYGFFQVVVPVELRQRGWDLDKIGLTALLLSPWALKFLWAPVLDRVWWKPLGRRRTWILSMQLAGMIVLGVAALSGGTSVTLLCTATFLVNLIAATQDIATDGLGVEMLDDDERGPANGLQVGAYRFGMVIGGGVLLLYAKELHQSGMFAVMAALTLLASLPVALAKEPPLPPKPVAAVDNVHFLRRPGVWPLVALLLVYKAGETFASAVQKPFLVDQKYDLEAIGRLTGIVGSTAGIAGAMLGGILVTKIGRRRSLVLFGLTQALAVSGYIYLAAAPPSDFALYAICTIETFASGAATATLFTCMMDWSERFSSGTDYTTQASTVVIAQLGFATLGGYSAQAFGYATHFAIASVLCVVAVASAYALFPTERRS